MRWTAEHPWRAVLLVALLTVAGLALKLLPAALTVMRGVGV